MKRLSIILLSILGLLYPLLWYIGREQGWFIGLAVLMMLLWLSRALLTPEPSQKYLAFAVCGFFLVSLWIQQEQLMYWYPVLINALFFSVFFSSLYSKRSFIERLARLKHADLPPQGVTYTRTITKIWCVFFLINGSIATILALYASHQWWAIYTGILAYLLMAILFAGELIYRKWVLKI